MSQYVLYNQWRTSSGCILYMMHMTFKLSSPLDDYQLTGLLHYWSNMPIHLNDIYLKATHFSENFIPWFVGHTSMGLVHV
jgi:hypothetical protein